MTITPSRVSKGIPTGGQFAATNHGESIVSLGGPTGRAPAADFSEQDFWAEANRESGNADIVRKAPRTGSEAKRMLKNSRGEPDGRIRMVSLDHGNAPKEAPGERVEIVGPRDGRPILVRVSSGIPFLKVTSGKAIIYADSSWGNSVEVADGAEAIVVASPDRKVTVGVDEGGKAAQVCSSTENRMRSHTHDRSEVPFRLGEISAARAQPETAEDDDEDDEDEDDDDRCRECGEPNDDGEGWDGLCGTCADRADPGDD